MAAPQAAPDALPRQQIATIAAAITCITVVGIGLSLSSPLISLVLAGRGTSATMIGLNTAFASLATLLIGPFVTPVAKAMGLRSFVILALCVRRRSLALFSVLEGLLRGSRCGSSMARPSARCSSCRNTGSTRPRLPPARHHHGRLCDGALARLRGGSGDPGGAGGARRLLFWIGALLLRRRRRADPGAGDLAPPIEGKSTRSAWGFITLAPIATVAGFVFGAIEQGSFAFLTLYGEKLGYSTTQCGHAAGALRPRQRLLATADRLALGPCEPTPPAARLRRRRARRRPCDALAGGSACAMMVIVFVTGGVGRRSLHGRASPISAPVSTGRTLRQPMRRS